MLMQQTLTQLKSLKLDGMARAFEEQAALTASTSLSFEERFGMVVDRELAWRDTRRLERLLKSAKLKNPKPASRTSSTGRAAVSTRASSRHSLVVTGSATRRTSS